MPHVQFLVSLQPKSSQSELYRWTFHLSSSDSIHKGKIIFQHNWADHPSFLSVFFSSMVEILYRDSGYYVYKKLSHLARTLILTSKQSLQLMWEDNIHT